MNQYIFLPRSCHVHIIKRLGNKHIVPSSQGFHSISSEGPVLLILIHGRSKFFVKHNYKNFLKYIK